MRITFEHSKEEALNIYTFYFRPEKKVNFKPGQFIEITLNHSDPDNRGTIRQFTLSSSPTDKLVSITTKIPPENSSTFTQALRSLKFGAILSMSEPKGTFLLPETTYRPLVFVAGGIGITPFHSMLTWVRAVGEQRPIKLLYAVNTEEEIIFQTTFDKLGHDATIVVGNPSSSWRGRTGRLTPKLILGIERPSLDTIIYISGPAGMVESLSKGLKKAGVKQQQLVLDAFSGYSSTQY